jgi:hypothetical protein
MRGVLFFALLLVTEPTLGHTEKVPGLRRDCLHHSTDLLFQDGLVPPDVQ